MGRLLPYFLGRLPFPMEALPDLQSLSDAELRDLIRELMDEERQVSYQRRILHGENRHPSGRAPARLKKQVGEGKEPPRRGRHRQAHRDSRGEGGASRRGRGVTHVHCPECGFQNQAELLLEVRRASHPRRAGIAHDDDFHS